MIPGAPSAEDLSHSFETAGIPAYTCFMRKEESLRRRLVFAVFFLFVLVVLIFVGAIRFLIKTNMVSMDHVRALGDLRQVGMYLDSGLPGTGKSIQRLFRAAFP
jgi:hypothetical protein